MREKVEQRSHLMDCGLKRKSIKRNYGEKSFLTIRETFLRVFERDPTFNMVG